MKRLYINIALISIPFLVLLTFIQVDRRLNFEGLENDCFNHAIWIYDRLYNNEKPVEIVFLGSSGTINGVDDKYIEEQLGDDQLHVANFGYCRLGRNLTYVLQKDILETKKIQKIYVEVREDEDRYSHPVFPYLADMNDILFPAPFFNRDIFSDIYHFYMYKLQLIQEVIFRKSEYEPIRLEDFGHATSSDTADRQFLLQHVKHADLDKKPCKLERNFYMKYPRAYLKKIYQLCQEQQIELNFIFLQGFGSGLAKPKEFETYKRYGNVLIPPTEIFENTDFWYDENHLNKSGAKALSNWIAEQIKD